MPTPSSLLNTFLTTSGLSLISLGRAAVTSCLVRPLRTGKRNLGTQIALFLSHLEATESSQLFLPPSPHPPRPPHHLLLLNLLLSHHLLNKCLQKAGQLLPVLPELPQLKVLLLHPHPLLLKIQFFQLY